MNPLYETTLENLTTDSVSVLKKPYFEFMGQRFYSNNIRNSYMNSDSGREQIKKVLSAEYLKAVMSVWGDTPTITDPLVE